MKRIRASVLEIKAQIGLGVLGLVSPYLEGHHVERLTVQPLVLDTIGFVPGCLVIVAIAVIITCTFTSTQPMMRADEQGPTM